MTPPSTPIQIFIAYSKHDEAYLKALLKHLKPAKKNNTIEVFHDGEIEAGKEWEKTIRANLHQSDIILLLVSANFVATDYCYDEEMIAAIALHEQGKAQVIPIIVTPFDFEDMPFAKLNFLPSKAKPISLYKDEGQHQAYTEIVIALKINYKEVYKRREVLQKARQEQEAQEKAEQERQEKEEKAAKRRQYD
ncbi:MAG TPA: toll/interleukin-1 receptor domain-containing protein, partial [Chitinophagales bacterium]|nr:toll/interleukin-1 receptor domain-containing protein [Chitinophagales bacterium]